MGSETWMEHRSAALQQRPDVSDAYSHQLLLRPSKLFHGVQHRALEPFNTASLTCDGQDISFDILMLSSTISLFDVKKAEPDICQYWKSFRFYPNQEVYSLLAGDRLHHCLINRARLKNSRDFWRHISLFFLRAYFVENDIVTSQHTESLRIYRTR